MEKGPISQFITHHYRHFNSAALVDAAKAYDEHMNRGGKMMTRTLSRRDDPSGQVPDSFMLGKQP